MSENNKQLFSSLLSKSQDALTSALNMMSEVQKNVEDLISSMISQSSFFQDQAYKSFRESLKSGNKSFEDFSNYLKGFLEQSNEILKSFGDFKYKSEIETIFNTISKEIKQILSYLKFD